MREQLTQLESLVKDYMRERKDMDWYKNQNQIEDPRKDKISCNVDLRHTDYYATVPENQLMLETEYSFLELEESIKRLEVNQKFHFLNLGESMRNVICLKLSLINIAKIMKNCQMLKIYINCMSH